MNFSDDDDHGETRSVDVVLLRATEDGHVSTADGDIRIRLADADPPDPVVQAALLASATRLAPSVDYSADLVRAIEDTSTPPTFLESPWLYRYKALVFRDGRCTVGRHVLRYHHMLGVYVDEPAAETVDDAPSTAVGTASSVVTSGSFDLLARPWLPVVRLDGTTDVVGLTELLLTAHRLRRIAGESPTMTAALYRLVIAVLHRIYGPENEAAWIALWSADRLPEPLVESYVERFRSRFDLFDPQRPFLQCVGLGTVTPSTPAKLVPYRSVGNNVTLFDKTISTDQVLLTPAEAARWLVTLQAFDPGGMKTPYVKDKSSERAPCNNFGVVLVEGGSLKETLLLNALVYAPDYEKPRMTTVDDRPVWEEPTGPRPEPEPARPARGWTHLLTWPSRRVLLRADREDGALMVRGVAITPGSRLHVSLPDEEKMAAYRQPRGPKGTPKRDAPMRPVRLHPLSGVWRHSVELLLTDTWEEGRSRQRPPALDQIAQLTERGHIPADTVYTLRVFGQKLDAKAAVIETWLEDEVPAPVALVRAKDENLGGLVGAAITLADEAGSALRALQANFRTELYAAAASDIEVGYWPQLAAPFRRFLRKLGEARVAGQSERPAAEDWGRVAYRIVLDVAERWAVDAAANTNRMTDMGKHEGVFRSRVATAWRVYHSQIGAYATGRETSDD
jgi:CRISPR system Cascade subunit CasA